MKSIIESLKNKNQLLEATRNQLIDKSKKSDVYTPSNQNKGRNRWERRVHSNISTTVADYNKIDMNAFWKGDILEFGITVKGETDTYVVMIIFEKILDELQKQVKSNKNLLEFKCILKALLNVFNTGDVYVSCSCPDFKYRGAFWATKGKYNSGLPQTDNGKWIANPHDSKGAGCKHINLVLSNLDWMMKIASVINNYIYYCKDNMENNYAQYIFPKIYGETYKDAVQLSLLDTDELKSDPDTLNLINALGRRRTQFKKPPELSVNPRYQHPTQQQPLKNELKLDLGDKEEENKEESGKE